MDKEEFDDEMRDMVLSEQKRKNLMADIQSRKQEIMTQQEIRLLKLKIKIEDAKLKSFEVNEEEFKKTQEVIRNYLNAMKDKQIAPRV